MFAPGKFWVQKLLAQNICINLFAKFGLNLALFSTTATIMTFKVLKVLGNQPLQLLQGTLRHLGSGSRGTPPYNSVLEMTRRHHHQAPSYGSDGGCNWHCTFPQY